MKAKIVFTEKAYFNYSNNRFIFPSKIEGLENSYSLCFEMTSELDKLTFIGDASLLIDPDRVFSAGTKFQCLWGRKTLLNGEFF